MEVHIKMIWGFAKGLVYVFPLSKDVDELKARITEAVATIDNAILECDWQELDYRLALGSTVLLLNIFEHPIKNLRLQGFEIHQMRCYILNSF